MSTPDQTPPSPSPSPSPSPEPRQPQPAPPSAQPQAPYPPYAGYPPTPPPYASGPVPSYPGYPGYPAYPQAPYGQPPYPQAGYPQPPAYQPPYGPGYPYPQAPYPPAPPKKGSGKTVGIVVGVIVGVLVLLCIPTSILVVSIFRQVGNIVAPYTAAAEFCIDEEQQDYLGAYQLLSSGVQQRYSQQEFVTFSKNRDTNSGEVQSCNVESSGTSQQITATTATLTVTLQLSDGAHTGHITLVKEGSDWLVDSADPSLQLF